MLFRNGCIKITLVRLTWQFRWRDVLSVLVGELLECSQATAEAQDGICRDTAIWQVQIQEGQDIISLFQQDSVDLVQPHSGSSRCIKVQQIGKDSSMSLDVKAHLTESSFPALSSAKPPGADHSMTSLWKTGSSDGRMETHKHKLLIITHDNRWRHAFQAFYILSTGSSVSFNWCSWDFVI